MADMAEDATFTDTAPALFSKRNRQESEREPRPTPPPPPISSKKKLLFSNQSYGTGQSKYQG